MNRTMHESFAKEWMEGILTDFGDVSASICWQNKSKELREIIMNLAPAYDKWLEETLTQGREEGRETTQVAIALRLLQRNMSLDDISQDTGLSIDFLQTLRWSTTDRRLSNDSPN